MKTYSSYATKPLRAPLPSIIQKAKDYEQSRDLSEPKKVYNRANLSRGKKSRLSISSQSSSSKDTQTASEKQFSSEDSFNDISRMNRTPSQVSYDQQR